jgi:hypothetical protein
LEDGCWRLEEKIKSIRSSPNTFRGESAALVTKLDPSTPKIVAQDDKTISVVSCWLEEKIKSIRSSPNTFRGE